LKNLIDVKSVWILLISILFVACNNSNKKEVNDKPQKIILGKSSGNCTCTPWTESVCNLDCVKSFMKNQSEYNTSIVWTGCTDGNSNPAPGCNGALNPNITSGVKFCYGPSSSPNEECTLYMEISNTPTGTNGDNCLPCLSGAPLTICIELKAHCDVDANGSAVVVFTTEDPDLIDQSTWSVEVIITGDPIVTFCCKQNSGGTIVNRCCTGQII
jgi:hypothetical protein